jgi:hypothetical protein
MKSQNRNLLINFKTQKIFWVLKLIFLCLFLFFIFFRLIQIFPSYLDTGKYRGSISKGINFSDNRTPQFISSIEGTSWSEPWGTWSDAKKADAVRIKFKPALPHHFILELTAVGYGPNASMPTTIRLLNPDKSKPPIEYKVIIGPTPSVYSFDFSIPTQRDANTFEIIPPKPISPKSLNPGSDDERLVGIGLINFKIKPIKKQIK